MTSSGGYQAPQVPQVAQVQLVKAALQQSDYLVAGADDFQNTMDIGMVQLLERLVDFIKPVLEQADGTGAAQDVPEYKLLQEHSFAEWNTACAESIANTLPVGAGVSKDAKFRGLVNGYQGKYKVPDLTGEDDKMSHLIKNAPRVGSEQLLRRFFDVNGTVHYHPFGGFFLAKIQELPYVIKFWLVLRNIVEVAPKMIASEDVTINYFAQLFPVRAESGKSLYLGLQEAVQSLWGCRFQAEAMDLEQKVRKSDADKLRESIEKVVMEHEYDFSFDDFGPSHLAWVSERCKDMKLKEVKMSAEMKAKVVDQSLQGDSPALAEWLENVKKIGDFKCVVLEGSDNCAGMHPGVIFTDETRANEGLPWKDQLKKYTQEQVEEAHANVVKNIQIAFPSKTVCIQGGFGVLEKEVDGALASVCAQLGQGGVAATLGSGAWLSWAKGTTRLTEMGLCDQK